MAPESKVNEVTFGISNPNLPGAFPETPDESGPRHNKLHKRNDPRGWKNPSQTPRGHGYTDSGVSGLGTGYSNAHNENYTYGESSTVHHAANVQQRSTDNAQLPAGYEHEFTNSNLMTGAYNPVGNSANNNSAISNNSKTGVPVFADPWSSIPHTQEGSAASEDVSRSNNNHTPHVKSNSPTSVAGEVVPASVPSRKSSNSRSEGGQPNFVRNGREHSETDHEEPYWGDIPRGTGVYNTVVGTGSDEKAPPTGNLHHRTALPTSSPHHPTRDETNIMTAATSRSKGGLSGDGVHNTVIGAGSAEYKPPINHQRAFPLVPSDHNGSPHEAPTHQEVPQSHVKENLGEASAGSGLEGKHHHLDRDVALAGAGATAAGYGAFEQNSQDEEKQAQPQNYASAYETGNPYSQRNMSSALDEKHPIYQSKTPTGAAPGSHGTQKSAHPNANAVNQPQNDVSGHNNNNNNNNSSSSYTQKDFSSVPEADTTRDNDSHTGRNAALAGAGAGIAGYGAHKYEHRDVGRERVQFDTPTSTAASTSPRGQPTVTTGPEQHTMPTKTDSSTRGADATATSNDAHQSVKHATAGAGVGAAAAAAAHHAQRKDRTAGHQKPAVSYPTPSRGAEEDPSHGGIYNVLSDGTPSGINLRKSSASAQGHGHGAAKAAAAATTAGVGAAGAYQQRRGSDGRDLAAPRSHAKSATSTAATPAGSSRAPAENTAPQTTRGTAAAGSGHGDGKYRVLANGTPSGVKTSSQRATTATTDTTMAQESGNNHNASGAATATATAAAAAAAAGTGVAGTYAVRDHGHDHRRRTTNDKPTTASTSASTSTAAPAAGTGAAPSASAVDNNNNNNNNNSNNVNDKSAPLGRSRADSSHGGQYNVLSSGTPSGVKIPGHAPQTVPGKQQQQKRDTAHHAISPTAPTSRGRHHHDDGAATAAVGTGGAGAGVAGAGLGSKLMRKDGKEKEREREREKGGERGGERGGKLVLHKCSNCGVEDDISGYLMGN